MERYGEWQGICDTHWTVKEANVLCRHLGYPGALKVFPGNPLEPKNHLKLYTGVNCTGDEESLDECVLAEMKSHECKTARVICNRGKEVAEKTINCMNGNGWNEEFKKK